MNREPSPDEMERILSRQIEARGLEPLTAEELYTLETPGAERDGMLEDLRDRVGLAVPDDWISGLTDEERSNGPRR